MRLNKLYHISLIVILALSAAAQAAHAGVVSTSALLSVDRLRPGDSFQLAVVAKITPGSHVSAPGKDSLYPPKLTIVAPKGIAFDKPAFPEAERKAFAIMPGQKIPVYEGTVVIQATGHVAKDAPLGRVTVITRLEAQGCKGDACFPPETSESRVSAEVVGRGAKIAAANQDVFNSANRASGGSGAKSALARAGFLKRLAMLYVLGLLLAFTPCVYPMIPVTVGYFAGQSERRTRRVVLLAGAYVLGLALTYSILGAIAATTGGIFGAAMQSPAVLLGIAGLLVVLALSMFGLYEIRPPAFIQDRASGKSGVLGALAMGLVFGIVAAPCVGPAVLSLLLLVAKIGSPLIGFALFFALALGVGTPLFFLAAFSAEMPVPGPWMVAVKKLAGFLLIGAAACFVRPVAPEWLGRLLVPLVVVAAGVYLGCFEKSLKHSRALWSLGKTSCAVAVVVAVIMVAAGVKRTSVEWQPYKPGAIAAAARSGKPSIVDFSARWCIACRELEHGPFSDSGIIRESARFARFRVDGTRRTQAVKAAEKELHVAGAGYPTVIFFDSFGREVTSARITGYVGSREMLRRLKSVR